MQAQLNVLDYTSLVEKIAGSIYKKINFMVQMDDLIQSGMIGLIDAVKKYQKKDAQFETYASIRIRGAIIDELRKLDNLSQESRDKLNKIIKAESDLIKEFNVKPSHKQIACKTGLDINEYFKVLNLKTYEKGFESWDSEVESEFENKQINKDLIKKVCDILDTFDYNEKTIMHLIYVELLTMKEAAKVMSLSEARISQIHKEIIYKLKEKLKL